MPFSWGKHRNMASGWSQGRRWSQCQKISLSRLSSRTTY